MSIALDSQGESMLDRKETEEELWSEFEVVDTLLEPAPPPIDEGEEEREEGSGPGSYYRSVFTEEEEKDPFYRLDLRVSLLPLLIADAFRRLPLGRSCGHSGKKIAISSRVS